MTSLDVLRLSGAEQERAASLPFSLLPVGSVEYHGAHAPFGTDSTLADGIAERIAAERACLRFPLLPYTFVPPHTTRHGPGVTVPPAALVPYLLAVLQGMLAFGPKRILVLNGHSENGPSLRLAAEELHALYPDVSVAIVDWWRFAPTPWRDDASDPWSEGGGHGHGGPLEISVTAAIHAGGVQVPEDERADLPYEAPWWRGAAQVVGRGKPPARFAGYTGRVSTIDVERGRWLLQQVVGEAVRFVDDWLARADAEVSP